MRNRTEMNVMRRQKMYRLVSSVRTVWSVSSGIRSRRTSERRIQLSRPRRKSSARRANRNEPMGPHCMSIPYANAEAARSRANIQKTGMAVLALYPALGDQPSARCNGRPARHGWARTRGQEQRGGEAGGGDEVAGAVDLREQQAGRSGDQDPVPEPAEAGVRAPQDVRGPEARAAELGRA